jgi:hypothetical protein
MGIENLDDVYALRRADAFGMAGQPLPIDFLSNLIARVDAELAASWLMGRHYYKRLKYKGGYARIIAEEKVYGRNGRK